MAHIMLVSVIMVFLLSIAGTVSIVVDGTVREIYTVSDEDGVPLFYFSPLFYLLCANERA